jgi:O-antigen/teichoic acid export membrane protein
MTRSIITTLGSRILVMLMSFAVVMLNTHFLGAGGQGTIALIGLGISLVLAVSNFIGGGSVVYLASRISPGSLVAPAMTWSGVVALLFAFFAFLSGLIPPNLCLHIALLAFIHASFFFHLQIMLGNGRIKEFNLANTIQSAFLLVYITLSYFLAEDTSLEIYLKGLYISYLATWIYSFISSRKLLPAGTRASFIQAFQSMWNYGKYAQASNLLHVLNKRLSLVLIEYLSAAGRSGVGIFSVGVQLSESALMASSSMSVVQYSKLATTAETSKHFIVTGHLLRLSLLISTPLAVLLAILPDTLFIWIFGGEISNLSRVLVFITPGIIALSADTILSHYFSANGKYRVNTVASSLAFIVLILSSPLLISSFGLSGASLAVSAAYVTQTLWHFIAYRKESGIKWLEVIPTYKDLQWLRENFLNKA